MKFVHGEPSFHLATPELDLSVTTRGRHLATMVFHLPRRDVSPYALAPWESANGEWSLLAEDENSLHLTMDAGGRFEKILTTRAGQHAVFCEQRISGLEGDFNYGNHPILHLSALPENAGRTAAPWNGRHAGRIGIEVADWIFLI
jgi:hypothetical protein